MYKKWKLDSEQHVSFVSQKYVAFVHRSRGKTYRLCLSFCQVDILKDIIHLIMVKGENNLYIPLGSGIVFMLKDDSQPCIQHLSRHYRRYFMFHKQSWRRYINYVHRRLISVIKYDRRSKDCQCSLANEINLSCGYRNALSHTKTTGESTHCQVLFRPTAHDAMEDERHNRSLFQRRCDSSDRKASDSNCSHEDERDSEMVVEDENEYDDGEH